MALAWIREGETIVEAPGVVDLIWVGDDPQFYKDPVDLFEKQKEGLDESYGKKDKKTGIQTKFRCKLCECDMASIITLRHHCGGNQHIIKSFKAKAEYLEKMKNEPHNTMKPDPDDMNPEYDLHSVLKKQEKSIVGLRYITEFTSHNRKPLYHCRLEQCENEQGDAGYMSRHIFSSRHRAAWIQKDQKIYNLIKLDAVLSYVDEYKEDIDEDYCMICQQESTDEVYKKLEQKIYRGAQTLPAIRKRRLKQENERDDKKFKLDHSDIAVDDEENIAEPGQINGAFQDSVLGAMNNLPQSDGQGNETKPILTEKDLKKQFKKDIAEVVKTCLNTHYPTVPEYKEGNRPLTREEYMAAAQRFTKQFFPEFMNEHSSARTLCITSVYEKRIKLALQEYLNGLNNEI